MLPVTVSSQARSPVCPVLAASAVWLCTHEHMGCVECRPCSATLRPICSFSHTWSSLPHSSTSLAPVLQSRIVCSFLCKKVKGSRREKSFPQGSGLFLGLCFFCGVSRCYLSCSLSLGFSVGCWRAFCWAYTHSSLVGNSQQLVTHGGGGEPPLAGELGWLCLSPQSGELEEPVSKTRRNSRGANWGR